MLGFAALEGHINAIADDFAHRQELSAHEVAFLLEKDIRLENGEFTVKESLKMQRLDDRIQFLYHRFSGQPINRDASWWTDLKGAMKLRNELTHPKTPAAIAEDAVKRALQAIIDGLDAIYQGIYKAKFPPAGRGLQSKLTF